MYRKIGFFPIAALSLLIVLPACQEAVPVWSAEKQIENLVLKFNQPLEYRVDLTRLKDTVNTRMEMELIYDPGIGRSDLPLFVVFEDDSHNIVEYPSIIHLKENNAWMGEPQPNEVDMALTQVAIPEMKLLPRKYVLKIYANDQDSTQIYGVIRMGIRIFENKEEKKEENPS